MDRDGTIMEDMEYSTDPAALAVFPDVVKALNRLQRLGYKLVIVTNQSGVARGIFTEASLQAFHACLAAWFHERGVRFDGIYYCPHYPEGKVRQYVKTCDCRKPAPGMLLRAAADLNIALTRSWMIGDRPADVGAGHAAGCRTIRLLTGEKPLPGDPTPDCTLPTFAAAADHIASAAAP